ncbi:hypothetical protein KP509_15G005600 [Ceratopteris richardii]|uniref:Plastocyanin-like domain-containing protein n=1 Tax=Ceratopteris richardii TaxID=49495 RepID=A0A8T2T0R8_CERRI|nr:hypothetical protein KP509_15G005600 [Ceratopteris richardii]KAH7404012.1 hypothetical protein KP509_15G005600 [Ceratopteris richardii]KAH7404015.1 hypothetical protein KP509_15G005600 [Ceratopteris richardii]
MRKWILMVIIANLMLSTSWTCITAEARAINNRNVDTEETLQKTEKLSMFVDELPSMPTVRGYTISANGIYVPASLTIGMHMKLWKFHRDLHPSAVFAFGESAAKATVPGPSIEAISGVKTYVRWENHLPDKHIFTVDETLEMAKPARGVPTVVHLHGSVSEPHSDGNARSWFTRQFEEKGKKWNKTVYEYHNVGTTSNLWYHDHALGYTRLNLLAGLIGSYKIVNPELDDRLGLPRGKFDRELVVMDRSFTKSGFIYINSTGDNPDLHPEWQPEYFGNVIIVNGKAWPYMKVQRRKYRFRIINASNARFFRFAMDDGSSFTQVGTDCFYLEAAIELKSVLLAPSEISDIVVDFSKAKKSTVILTNDAAYPFPDGNLPDGADRKIMEFMIKDGNVTDNSRIPIQLQPLIRLSEEHVAIRRNIVLFEFNSPSGQPTHLNINFASFKDPVTELPKYGTTELWHIINLTPDNHPFHVHLVGFQVLHQRKLKNVNELSACTVNQKGVEACNISDYVDGDPILPPANEAGWKNVLKTQPAFVTSILVHFGMIDFEPFPFDPTGEPGYVYHCHVSIIPCAHKTLSAQ